MEKTKVTEKYQVTIPKKIREKIGLKPGEIVIVEAKSRDEIRLKRFGRVKDPLKILIGKRRFVKHIPIEELEERMEE
ncbi:MAG: AbrB/MazE/SpoVT family DNA-binding domain-containing protein [Thermoplasmata archaeon]|nr:AbrB/MazE/SpoVT family DNA-binding domain-containing protein [Thermoplasmata archaeon]